MFKVDAVWSTGLRSVPAGIDGLFSKYFNEKAEFKVPIFLLFCPIFSFGAIERSFKMLI